MIFDLIVAVIISPINGFNQLRKKKTTLVATGVILVANIPNLINDLTTGSVASLLTRVLVASFGTLVGTILVSFLINIISRLLGGQGTFPQTYQALGFTAVPLIFLGPFAFLQLFFPDVLLLSFMQAMISLVLLVWTAVLCVISISITHSISSIKAFLILVLPPLFLVSIGFGLIVALRILIATL